MTLHSLLHSARECLARFGRWVLQQLLQLVRQAQRYVQQLAQRAHARSAGQPVTAIAVLFVAGAAFGIGADLGVDTVHFAKLQARNDAQQRQLDGVRREAQREVNALAARMGELQAETNRLNALGERLTRIGQFGDGEFDFDKPVGVGGAGPVRDMPAGELRSGMRQLDAQLHDSGRQLSVLEALLFNRELDRNAMPSRDPIADSYITSGYGRRADPFNGGRAFHRGIDFEANVGDPVLAVADGVVSYAGRRSGYGNVIEVDHGNGYVTRYAHNSRLLMHVGDLVRNGQQIAKAGSTGRSTGAHVHFEVWENGRVRNPRKFLGEHGVKRQ